MTESPRVRFIYRSRSVQYPMLAALRASGAWEQVGLDAGNEFHFVSSASKADPMLMNGEVDFILGSHVTPYLRYDEGVPFVYLGQTVNTTDSVVVTRLPINGLEELRGLRIADAIGEDMHPHGNHIMYLRRSGVSEDEVTWIDIHMKQDPLEAIVEGVADASFVGPLEGRLAKRQGVLSVYEPEPLSMVVGSTLTTLWPFVEKDPDLYRKTLQALRIGIAFFLDEPEAMMNVMHGEVARELGIDDEEDVIALYYRNCDRLVRTLYPNDLSVTNAFELAVIQRPDLRDRVSPLALWDMHFLRELDAADRVESRL